MDLEDKNSQLISNRAAESIVEICFMITDLKHGLDTEKITGIKNLLSSDMIIQNKMDGLLSAMTFLQFRNRLMDINRTIEKLLELFDFIDCEFQGKKNVEKTLKGLKKSLSELDNLTVRTQ